MRTSILPVLALLAFGSAATYAQPGGGDMPPTAVEVARPSVERVVEQVTAVGTLRAAEGIIVRPELAGRIERIHFEEGQTVAAGEPLFSLDADLVRAEVNEWEANVAQSRRETSRTKDLVERKLTALADLDAKRAELAVNEARLSSARTRLAKTVIHAPFTGTVGLRVVSPGQYVEVGQDLVTFGQANPIKLDFRVPETQLSRVAVGQTVQVEVDAYPGEHFTGMVYALDSALDIDGRSMMLRATLPNAEGRLRPGLFARVALELTARESALLVPEQALWPQGDKQFVYVVNAGKAELVEVTTGVRRDGQVEIRTGLTPESTVIVAGQLKIGPGSPVMPAQPAGGAPQAASN